MSNNLSWPGWETGPCIGKGGFGNVYEIHREGHGIFEKAALKVITIPQSEEEIDFLRCEGMDDESITTQFDGYVNDIIREYKMMIGLKNCPNIVHVDDYMTIRFEDGLGWNIFLKMELLKPMLKALDQVSTERQIIKFAMDICNALVVCQKKSILHRDIKPQNIFLAEDGCWKLGDFGIARSANRTTIATVGVGTYNFMAPEVMNNKPYGPSADIYSLGLVLYWLLNKCRGPFLPLPPQNYTPSMDEEAKRRRFSGERIPDPATGSPALQKIVLKACAFDPSQRYVSAQLMYSDLKKLYDGTLTDDTGNQVTRYKNEPKTQYTKAASEKTLYSPKPPVSKDLPKEKKKDASKKSRNWIVIGFLCIVLLLLSFILGTIVARFTARDKNKQFSSSASAAQNNSADPIIDQDEAGPVIKEPEIPSIEKEPVVIRREYIQVDGGLDHTVVLYNDGTVEAIGSNNYGQCDVEGWSDIVQISTMRNHTVGLRSDGTVVATGTNADGQCNVSGWNDIIAVSAGDHHTIGLRSNGTVVSAGKNQSGECEVQGWSDIVAVGAAYTNTFGLCSDGTVIVSGSYKKGKVPGWENIQEISVSDAHIVGLCADGTVKAVGNNNHQQCDLADWKDIISVATGCAYTTGLKSDGTVLVKGVNDVGQYDARQWRNIKYIATGLEHTIGVKTDGTFVAVGANDNGQCNVSLFANSAGENVRINQMMSVCDLLGTAEEYNTDHMTPLEEEMSQKTFWRQEDIRRNEIGKVVFLDSTASKGSNYWDISAPGDSSVIAWETNGTLYVAADGVITLGKSVAGLFSGFTNVKSIEFNNNIDTSQVTDMQDMFLGCWNLKSIDLSGFDTRNVCNMSSMFGSTPIQQLDVSMFDTSNVVNMAGMFANCENLQYLDLSSFDTAKVDSMSSVFGNCYALSYIDLSSFNTQNVTDMNGLFYRCRSLQELDLSGFDTRNVKDMSWMFAACNMQQLDISGFSDDSLETVSGMFRNSSISTLLTNSDVIQYAYDDRQN